MSTYGQYQDARDAAWRALLELPEKKLPVDVDALAKKLGVEIHPFPGKEQALLHNLVSRAAGGPCVSLRIRRAWHIFVRPKAFDESHRRFAIAHELGHLVLLHETESLAPGVRCFAARENIGDVMEDTQELETYTADLFAIRLLAPACLLHEMHIDSSGEIIRVCGLPPHAAVIRAERMQLLNERDVYYTHILETKVRNAFLPWLNSMRFPESAAIKLRYASESAPVMEIHGYPKTASQQEEASSEAASPPRSEGISYAIATESPRSLQKGPLYRGKAAGLRFLIRRKRKSILIGTAVLLAGMLLYLFGR